MGGQSNEPIILNSSIALLQERFKQLQRAREMREERELYRSVVFRSHSVDQCGDKQSKWLFPGAPSGRLHGEGDHMGLQGLDTSLSMGWWSHRTGIAQGSAMSNETDVDTSLHL